MAKRSQMPKQSASTATAGATRSGSQGKGKRYVRSRSGNRYLVWWIIGAVVVVFVGIILLNWQSLFGGGSQASLAPRVSEGLTWGPANAPVSVVEYSNFGCIHCRNFALGDGQKLRQQYESTGKVRFQFKNFKLADPTTADAANASLCAADQNRFWDYHDRLFTEQTKSARPFGKPNLKQYGADLGLDTAKFNYCVDNDQHMDQVNQDSTEGVGQGVEGTPTFFVNGKALVGEVPLDQIKQAIDAAAAAKGG